MRWLLTALVLCAAILIGCENDSDAPAVPNSSNDSAVNEPIRVVSFLPSLTKMFFDTGLDDYLVGVTTFCPVPDGQELPIVGNMLNIRVEPILAVEPDIVLAQAEQEKFAPLLQIQPDLTVEIIDMKTLDDIASAMVHIGQIVGEPEVGTAAAEEFNNKLQAVRDSVQGLQTKTAIFMMFSFGYSSPLCGGGQTFIDEMLTIAGGQNVLTDNFEGWHTVAIEAVVELAPEVIICQCSQEQAADVQQYWQQMGQDTGWAKQVFIVTEDDWTIPAGHMADYTAVLAEMLHAIPVPAQEGE